MALLDQPDSPELRAFSNSIAGGAVDAAAPHMLNPTQAAYLLNTPVLIDGQRQKRRGVVPRGPNQPTFDRLPHGVFTLDTGQYRKLVVRLGNQLWANEDSELFWTRHGCTISLADLPYMAVQGVGFASTSMTDMLFMCACASLDPTANTYAQTAYFTAGGETLFQQSVLPGLRAATFYQRRGWGIDDAKLYWSELNRIDHTGSSTAGCGNITIGSTGFDYNMAVTGTRDVTPQLLIWRLNSVWLLDIYWETDGYYGETPASGTMDFTKALIRPIIQETGLIATRAVTWTPGARGGDFIFLSREGLRSLQRSLSDAQAGSSLPLSWRIQGVIDRINWDKAHLSSMAFHDGVVYTSVPVDGATQNNFVIAYDLVRDAFWYSDWPAENFTRVKWTGHKTQLYFQSTIASSETIAGIERNGYHIYRTDTGPYDPFLQPVKTREETRGFTFDRDGTPGSGLDYKKRWGSLELCLCGADNGSGITLAIGYKLDHAATFTNFGFTYLAGTETGIVYRRFDLSRIPPGYTLEFIFEDLSSFDRNILRSYEVRAYPLNQVFNG